MSTTKTNTIPKRRYVLTIEDGDQHLYPITEDQMFFTAEQLPAHISAFMPEYSLRKRSKAELFIKKWYYKLYLSPKYDKNYKKFLEKVKEANIKNNPHFTFKKY